MIYDIKKIGEATYLLNESVKITIDEQLVAHAEYDDAIITENEVNEMIDHFFAVVEKQIAKSMGIQDKV